MTNREKIHRAFDAVQPARTINVEEITMHTKLIQKPLAALCAALILLLCGLTAAYAADLGGIRETITVWFGGRQQVVEVTQPHEGMIEWTDEEGKTHFAGGVAIDDDGNEQPVTYEELLAHEFSGGPVIDFFEDEGTAFLEFYEHYVDVTDQVPTGRIAVQLDHDGVTYYITEIGSQETGWQVHVSTEGFADQP
ncbi:MAG: hypothetical protein IJ662_00825 [Clostridia bacterium]|nr:hypothetical protein [Clostridia bacterium]